MPNSEAVRTRVPGLAEGGAPTDEAVRQLMEWCGDRRVGVVRARQQLLEDLRAHPRDPVVNRAVELLALVLERLPGD